MLAESLMNFRKTLNQTLESCEMNVVFKKLTEKSIYSIRSSNQSLEVCKISSFQDASEKFDIFKKKL